MGVLHSGDRIATWFIRHVHVSTVHFVRQGKWAKNTGLFLCYEFCGTPVEECINTGSASLCN